jgi:two-component system, NarL family, response regulator
MECTLISWLGSARKDLVEVIRFVHGGQRRIPHEVASTLALHLADEALSDRERHVLHRVAAGRSNKRVAHEIGLPEETVKSHMKNIMVKLAANNRNRAVTIALGRGLIELPPDR